MGKKNKIQTGALLQNSDPDLQTTLQQLSDAAANTNTAKLTVNVANATNTYGYASDSTDVHSGYCYTPQDIIFPGNESISNLGSYTYTINSPTTYHARVDANNLYIEFHGTEYLLADFLYKLEGLENLIKQVPDLLDKVANLSEVVDKLEREDALKKLEQVINN